MTALVQPALTAQGRDVEVAVEPQRLAGGTSELLRLVRAEVVRSPSPDLEVRLHTPLADVVVVRVLGTLDERSVELLVERVDQQLDRATHVVLDLGEVSILCQFGVRALHDLHRQADARGVRLHITGDAAGGATLRRAGLGCVLDGAGSADALIALLALRRPETRRPDTRRPDTRRPDGVVVLPASAGTGRLTPPPVPIQSPS